jgi:hypothetical protein
MPASELFVTTRILLKRERRRITASRVFGLPRTRANCVPRKRYRAALPIELLPMPGPSGRGGLAMSRTVKAPSKQQLAGGKIMNRIVRGAHPTG